MEGSGGREEGEIEERRYAADAESGEEERARRTPAIARCREAAVGISSVDSYECKSAWVGSYICTGRGRRTKKRCVERDRERRVWVTRGKRSPAVTGPARACSGGQLIAREGLRDRGSRRTPHQAKG